MQAIIVVDEGEKAITLIAIHPEKVHVGKVQAHEIHQVATFLWHNKIGMIQRLQ